MSKNGKRNENYLVYRLMKKGFIFGVLVMLFVAMMASVGAIAVAGADDEGKLLVSIKGRGPSLSPDWNKIAFVSTEEWYYSVCIIDSDGSNLKKLTESVRVGGLGSWSPKGDKILYWIYNPEDEADLWIMNSDGTEKKRIAQSVRTLGEGRTVAIWSPDGNKFAYGGYDGVHVVNADGRDDKLIGGRGLSLSWTPDSKKIYLGGAFLDVESGVIQMIPVPTNITTSDITPRMDHKTISPDASKVAYISEYNNIWVANIDGSNLKQLPFGTYFLRWNPDSKRIAFVSGAEGTIREGIWVTNFDGSDQKKIAKPERWSWGFFDSLNTPIIWNPDGSKIAYATFDRENGTTNIYTINVGKPSPVKPPAGESPSEKQPGVPGFEAVFVIGGLLAVAYLLRRKK